MFDGAVFSTKRLHSQFFVKYCIQRPFVENVTALIKMWCFFRRRFIDFSRKKGEAEAEAEAEADALYASRCDIF